MVSVFHPSIFCFFRVRLHRTILGRQVLGISIFSFWFNCSSSQIQSRDSWVRSENATAVLCRPPFFDQVRKSVRGLLKVIERAIVSSLQGTVFNPFMSVVTYAAERVWESFKIDFELPGKQPDEKQEIKFISVHFSGLI